MTRSRPEAGRCVLADAGQCLRSRYTEDMSERNSGPSTKHLRHSAVIHRGRSLTSHNQSPAFKLVSTHSTKAVDVMLSVTFRRLVHDQAEMVSALGTVSSDVLSHQPDSYRRIRLSRKDNLERVNSRLADD
jgi:hypothetical protein